MPTSLAHASGAGAPDVLLSAFARLVGACPDRALVVSPRRSVSVRAVADAAGRLAAWPGIAEIEEGAVVGLAAPNGAALLAGLVALRMRGAVVVLLDEKLSRSEHVACCAQLHAAALVSFEDRWAFEPSVTPLARSADLRPPKGTAFLRTTSGSTGLPRGIALSSDAVLADHSALAASIGLRGSDRIVAAIPMSHAYGLSTIAMPALVHGATVVVGEDAAPLAQLEAARACEASVFPTVPAWLSSFTRLEASWPPSASLVLSAGALLPPDTARAFREKTGRSVHVLYGASECGGICYDRIGGAAERGRVGTPVEGASVSLSACDSEDQQDEGIVVVMSPGVATGYWPDEGDGLRDGRYRSADLAAWRDGELELRGREDALINVRGRKVRAAEIERVLREMPGCRDVVVVPLPTGTAEGDRIRAVIACDSATLSASDVLTWCSGRLAAHKVPKSLVLLPEIPHDARGKAPRSALQALASTAEAAGA